MEEEEEDFDETNKSSPNFTHHHYMLLINTVRAIKARVEQSNVKSTQKQPSPHLTNSIGLQSTRKRVRISTKHAYGNKWHKQNKRSQQKGWGFYWSDIMI